KPLPRSREGLRCGSVRSTAAGSCRAFAPARPRCSPLRRRVNLGAIFDGRSAAVTLSSSDGMEALLRRPAASVLAPALREALAQAWRARSPATAEPAVAWPVLADTLDALALLSADEATLLAALLFDLPPLRAQLAGLPWPDA